MPAIDLTLPITRRSPINIPRRDLTLDSADTLLLRLALVTSDTPGAAPVDLAGIGPRIVLAIWQAQDAMCGDYGTLRTGVSVWTGRATITDEAGGLAEITVPAGALGGVLGRLGWSVHLDYAGILSALTQGALNLSSSGQFAATAGLDLLTDDDVPITTDADLPLEV